MAYQTPDSKKEEFRKYLEKSGVIDHYYWYYATQVMYHMQGKYWLAWNEPLRKTLVATQQAGGHMAGTWNPADNWENQGGRIYATAMKLLVLEVYYRHLPLFRQINLD